MENSGSQEGEKTNLVRTHDRDLAVADAHQFLDILPGKRTKVILKTLHFMEKTDRPFTSLVDFFSLKNQSSNHTDKMHETEMVKERLMSALNSPHDGQNNVHDERNQSQKPKEELNIKTDNGFAGDQQIDPEQKAFSLHELSGVFDKYGSILIPPGELSHLNPELLKFYTFSRHYGEFDGSRGSVDLRGLDFNIAADRNKNLFEKFDTIQSALLDGIQTVSSVKREEITSLKDYLLYLGVFDYLKAHSILLFHSLSFPERMLKASSDPKYMEQWSLAYNMSEEFTRMYYQILLGKPFNSRANLGLIEEQIPSLVAFTRNTLGNIVGGENYVDDPISYKKNKMSKKWEEFIKEKQFFKLPDTEHPLLLAHMGLQLADTYPDIDSIIGIPSGGTELAFITEYCYELLRNKTLPVEFIPLSLHSGTTTVDQIGLDTYVSQLYPDTFSDKNVLVLDDNAPTGETFSKLAKSLVAVNARSVTCETAEFDPTRLISPGHPDGTYRLQYNSNSLGVTPLSERGRYGKIHEIVKKVNEHRQEIRRLLSAQRFKEFQNKQS